MGEVANDPHALSAAACGRLDQQRRPDRGGGGHQSGVRLIGAVSARQCGDSVPGRQASRGGLVAYRPDRLGGRTDPADAGSFDGCREVRAFGQEAVPGMERVRTGGPGGRDDCRAIEEVDRRTVGAGVVRADAQPLGRSSDPRRDLAAIGHEQGVHRTDVGGNRRGGRAGRGRLRGERV